MLNNGVLVGKQVQLRPLRIHDEADVWSLLSDPQIRCSMTRSTGSSYHSSKQVLAQLLSRNQRDSLHFAICLCNEGEKFIGIVSFQRWNSSKGKAMLGYMLDSSYWHRGLTTEAVGLLLQFAINNLGLRRIEGRCRKTNKASAKVMLKNGLVLERVLPLMDGSDEASEDGIHIYGLTIEEGIQALDGD
ncbi:GNAT family N-acetyltransferase [Paenibacillus sp. IHBB 10380]|uniref:GNAT family N-acetyltransferase n=1 Tax=Paenibacillus sp. IHBB 10380 TaxID=1566358 RepID=UPI000696EF7B|nr:GNAT family N-acetyltransferase [Paenibacillus sp. IHBB 10380]